MSDYGNLDESPNKGLSSKAKLLLISPVILLIVLFAVAFTTSFASGVKQPNFNTVNIGKGVKLNPGMLQDSIEVVVYANDASFNEEIKKFPASLKEITFSNDFNSEIKAKFPVGTEKIIFGTAFNNVDVLENIGDKVTYLNLGGFDKDLLKDKNSVLPVNLETLVIQGQIKEFNGLPNNLKELIAIGIEGTFEELPASLETLTMGLYTKEIKKLPMNLKDLTIGYTNAKKLDLPKSIVNLVLLAPMEHLELHDGLLNLSLMYQDKGEELKIPSTILQLVLPMGAKVPNKLPGALQSLTVDNLTEAEFMALPKTVKTLNVRDPTFLEGKGIKLTALPYHIETLTVGAFTQQLN